MTTNDKIKVSHLVKAVDVFLFPMEDDIDVYDALDEIREKTKDKEIHQLIDALEDRFDKKEAFELDKEDIEIVIYIFDKLLKRPFTVMHDDVYNQLAFITLEL
jgi:hypothetical protein